MKMKRFILVPFLAIASVAFAGPGAPAPIVNCIDNVRCTLGLPPTPPPPGLPNPPVPGQNVVMTIFHVIFG